jgi:hypothetical protein
MEDTHQLAVNLRKLADTLERLSPRRQWGSNIIVTCCDTKTQEDLDLFLKDLKVLGSFTKIFNDENFQAHVSFGPDLKLILSTQRSSICTKRTVRKEVEVEEWDCDSILDKALAKEGIVP